MKYIYLLLISVIPVIFIACGEGIIEFDQKSYQPKIVVEGYLFPGNKAENIKISRNYPLNTTLDSNTIFIPDAIVEITDIENNITKRLVYDFIKKRYAYNNNDFIIQYGKGYKLSVTANIDGRELKTSSITATPPVGIKIDNTLSRLGDFLYREKDQNGNLRKPVVTFSISPGTEFYVFSVTPVDATMDTFIKDNVFGMKDSTMIHNHWDLLRFPYTWFENKAASLEYISKDVDWSDIWFYSKYMVIIYAGDQNYKDFLLSHNMIMEMDGNIHEPRFHFEGDGIGIFGSAVADTAYFEVKRN